MIIHFYTAIFMPFKQGLQPCVSEYSEERNPYENIAHFYYHHCYFYHSSDIFIILMIVIVFKAELSRDNY